MLSKLPSRIGTMLKRTFLWLFGPPIPAVRFRRLAIMATLLIIVSAAVSTYIKFARSSSGFALAQSMGIDRPYFLMVDQSARINVPNLRDCKMVAPTFDLQQVSPGCTFLVAPKQSGTQSYAILETKNGKWLSTKWDRVYVWRPWLSIENLPTLFALVAATLAILTGGSMLDKAEDTKGDESSNRTAGTDSSDEIAQQVT